jgi:tetratricopeptide (TPR) repeat protein
MIHLVRAREYLARGELAMAMAECRESLTLDPHDMQALLLEGEILFQMGRYGEAAAAFQEVTMLYPSEEEAYTRLGNTYLLLGDYPAAEKAYIRSLAIRPNDPVVRKNLEKATSLAGRVNAVRKEGVLEKDTVTGTVSPAVEESPAPAEIATLREGGTVPVPFGTPTTDLSPVPSLFALVVVTLLSRIGEMDRRFFFYLKGSG